MNTEESYACCQIGNGDEVHRDIRIQRKSCSTGSKRWTIHEFASIFRFFEPEVDQN